MPLEIFNLINSYDEGRDEKAVGQFLAYVAQGEQDQAERMLESAPDLCLEKGTITDLSKRTFKNITAFQYALWVLDWRMWTMILHYLPLEEAAVQGQEWEEKRIAYGKYTSWQGLINAYAAYSSDAYLDPLRRLASLSFFYQLT